MAAELCKEALQIRDRSDWGNQRTCGRPVVEDGLCRIHLNARNKRQAAEVAWKEQREASNRRQELARQRQANLRELGVPGGIVWENGGFKTGYTGSLILDGDAVDWLIERLRR